MKTDFNSSNNSWSNVATVAIIALVVVAFFVLFVKCANRFSNQLNEKDNAYARCKSAGGEMGYSKCYKNGKEI